MVDIKAGDRLAVVDAYGKIVAGTGHHEFEVVKVNPANGKQPANVELRQLN